MKFLEIKRKHHYVWAHYLKAWCVDNNDVYYISQKNNICKDSIFGLSCKKDFYKIQALTGMDIFIAQKIISESDPILREVHKDFLDNVVTFQCLFNSEFLKNSSAKTPSPSEVFQANFFEDYLSTIEKSAVDFLEQLRNGDLQLLENKDSFYDFCYFIGYQFSRTLKIKNAATVSNMNLFGPKETILRLQEFTNKHWWFMCSFFGTNLAYDLSLNKSYKTVVINNDSDEVFLTSDQPVININPYGAEGECIDFYYPLSERKALLFLSSDYYQDIKDVDTVEEVEFFNKAICKQAGATIYSSSKKLIMKYKKGFNARSFKS